MENQNPDCSDFDNLDVDGLYIDGQLFCAVDVWIDNSSNIFDKKVEGYKRNYNFLKTDVSSYEIRTSVGVE